MRSSGNDTIAAVATPQGTGGIGIVRVSGPDALAVAARVFRGRGGRPLEAAPAFQLRLGTILDAAGAPIDEALAVRMPAGASYTGEPTVEIQAHGGPVVMGAVLRAVLDAGARLADPGEFTRRAFLSGRIDLSQAEAVAELIGAESEEESRLALSHLRGGLAARVREIRSRLLDLASGTEALLDFGDEEGAGVEPAAGEIAALAADIRALAARGRGRVEAGKGTSVVLAGRTNSGKSSLFNVLVNFERSIVSPFPGTTRDYVEERSLIGGTSMTLVDTAGIRESDDPVESEGVRRSLARIEESDVVVFVVDGSRPADPGDLKLLEQLRARSPIVVLSKADLCLQGGVADLGGGLEGLEVCPLSAHTGEGLPRFLDALVACCKVRARTAGGAAAPNVRQQEALGRAAGALEEAALHISADARLLDLVAAHLKTALEALGEITGETASEEILERVFGRFCLGK